MCYFYFLWIFSYWSIYLNVPPNVGVQKSAVFSAATGNVLDIGTRHSPLLLKSCSFVLIISEPCKHTSVYYKLCNFSSQKSKTLAWFLVLILPVDVVELLEIRHFSNMECSAPETIYIYIILHFFYIYKLILYKWKISRNIRRLDRGETWYTQ